MKLRPVCAVAVAALAATGLAAVPSLSDASASASAPRATVGRVGSGADDASVRSGLGNGLGRLLAQQQGASAKVAGPRSPIRPGGTVVRDKQGRVLVDLTPQDGTDRKAFRRQAEAAGLKVTAVDKAHGVLEGYVALADVTGLAGLADTGTLVAAAAAQTNAGSVDDFGVKAEQADKVQARGIKGKGITVGALSDSYDTAPDAITRAADDVASGDLPGKGNPENDTKPVRVLEDYQGGEDEGRGMLQIVHDMAPKARLCFATAEGGDVGFAANIRRLADPQGPCKADVVVDDISYYDEPFFSDGLISDAIDDVASKGVQYYSSAGNGGSHQTWQLPINLVPAADAAQGTNLDFSQVPTALYDGGVQDMNPGSGVDPAMTYALTAAGGIFNLQWDDPIDYAGPTLGDPIYTADGELTTAQPEQSFTFTPTADQLGQKVVVTTDGVPSGSVDLILTVTKPDGTTVGPVDTGTSPETAGVTLDQAGDYTITVDGYAGSTGPFTVDVRPVTKPSKVTDDFNALLFDMDGNYLGALADDNTLSGRPQELASLGGFDHLQIVVGRSGTGPLQATTLAETSNNTGMYVDEYYDPSTPDIYGHPTAKGATAVGAYNVFPSLLPEYFTSQGGDVKIRYDSDGNAYPTPQVRRVPSVSGIDGANTTFFVSDTLRDPDTLPNFFGTSASAPHVAAIGALMLQAAGGPGSLAPSKAKTLLTRSTFGHDLDPNTSTASAGGVTITAHGDQSSETAPYDGTNADPNFFTVTNTGSSPVSLITLDGSTASPSAYPGGIVFDPRAYTGPPATDQGFPFTVGSTSGGLDASSVSASFNRHLQGTPQGTFQKMTLRFAGGLQPGQSLTFGVDRDLAQSEYRDTREGNSADELGGAVLFPSDRAIRQGMGVRVLHADGSAAKTEFVNQLGQGYSIVDGYGLVDAQQAVNRVRNAG